METEIRIGDEVPLKAAILFGLETYLASKLEDENIGVIDWGREIFGNDEAENIIVSFIEPPKPIEIETPPQYSPIRTYTWTIYIQGIMPDTPNRPLLPAYRLVAEVKKALAELYETNNGQRESNLLNLGPTAQKQRGDKNNLYDMKIGSETVRGPGEHSRYTFFWLPLHLTIAEDLKNTRTITQDPL